MEVEVFLFTLANRIVGVFVSFLTFTLIYIILSYLVLNQFVTPLTLLSAFNV